MSDYRPIDHWEYLIDNMLVGQDNKESNRLLDEDTHEPKNFPQSPSLTGLSAIAAALDRWGPEMKPEHLEKAVWWIKDWKMFHLRRFRTIGRPAEFFQAMRDLTKAPTYRQLERKARRYNYASQAFAALFGVSAFVCANAWLSTNEGVIKSIGLTLLTLFLAALTGAFRDAARDYWKAQDRDYFLKCLRLSRDTEDLTDAGLFADPPGTPPVSSADEHMAHLKAIRALHLQLADAIYCDDDRFLREKFNEREMAESWNWSSSKKGA